MLERGENTFGAPLSNHRCGTLFLILNLEHCGHTTSDLASVSLATRLCYHRRVQPPPAAVGGPLNETKVGPASDSDPFEFAWDHVHVAPLSLGAALTCTAASSSLLPVGTSLDRAGAGAALWDGDLDNENLLG